MRIPRPQPIAEAACPLTHARAARVVAAAPPPSSHEGEADKGRSDGANAAQGAMADGGGGQRRRGKLSFPYAINTPYENLSKI